MNNTAMNKYYYLTYIITLIVKIFNTYNRTIIILILKYKNIIMILIINGVRDGSIINNQLEI